MTEKQKIRKLVKEYKALLKATDMDVAESVKGQWFFSRYDKENDCYEVLVRFQTARELAEIILGELATDIFLTIECEPEENPLIPNFADDLQMNACYQPQIERLIKYLGIKE